MVLHFSDCAPSVSEVVVQMYGGFRALLGGLKSLAASKDMLFGVIDPLFFCGYITLLRHKGIRSKVTVCHKGVWNLFCKGSEKPKPTAHRNECEIATGSGRLGRASSSGPC